MVPLSQSSPLAIQSPFKAQLAMGLVIFAACLIGIALRPIGYLSIFWPANQLLLFMQLRYAHVLLRPSGLAVLFAAFVAADVIMGSGLWVSIGFTVANIAGGLAGWLILRHQSERDLHMQGQYSGLLVFYGSGIAALVSAVIGAPISTYMFDTSLSKTFLLWFSGEWLNAMVLLPTMLALPTWKKIDWTQLRTQWPLLTLPAIAVALLEAASYTVGDKVGSLVFSLPALLWCALTYRILTTALITMVVFATKIIISNGYMDFTPAHYVDAVTLRLGITMLILGPLSVAGAQAATAALMDRLQHAATHDFLTRVLSRQGFTDTTTTLLQRLRYGHDPVAMLMLDIDHFKSVNDLHGHATGDRLLQDFAHTVSQVLRPQDVLGRIGGEEFAVVLPQISACDAQKVAQRICDAVRQHMFATADNQCLRATVSVGVFHQTALQSHHTTDALLHHADIALYQAKTQGRDRLVIYSR